jgi:hypothetical protein
MKKKQLIAIFLITIFSGCEKKEKTELDRFIEQPVQTVEWYRNNSNERERVIKLCQDNIGQLKDNPNCINASGVVASAFNSKERIETPKAITFPKKD